MSKSIVKNAFYKILLNMFNLVVPIIVATYTYGVIDQDLIGAYNYGFSIFNYFFIFAGFGIYNYALREISRIRNDKKKLSQLFTNFFILGIASNVIVLIIYVLFDYMVFKGSQMFIILLILAINIVSNIFYVEWTNEALENYGFITAKTVVVRLVYMVFLFLTVKSSEDFYMYVFLTTFSSFLNNIISYVYIRRNVGFDFSSIKIKKHIKPLLLVIVMANGNVLYTQLDRVMIGHYNSKVAVAYYSVAQNIMGIINALVLSIVLVTIPRLSSIIASKDKEQYLNLLHKISQTLCAFLFPTAMGLFILAEEVVFLFGRGKYPGGGPILKVFAIYMISLGLESILSNQVMYINKKEKQLVKMIFVYGILNTILNFLLVKFNVFNESTAIITTAISNYLLVATEYMYIRKVLKIKFNLLSYKNLKYLLFSLSFLVVNYGVRMVISNLYLYVVTIVLLSMILYTVILFITKDEILNAMLGKVKERFGR